MAFDQQWRESWPRTPHCKIFLKSLGQTSCACRRPKCEVKNFWRMSGSMCQDMSPSGRFAHTPLSKSELATRAFGKCLHYQITHSPPQKKLHSSVDWLCSFEIDRQFCCITVLMRVRALPLMQGVELAALVCSLRLSPFRAAPYSLSFPRAHGH